MVDKNTMNRADRHILSAYYVNPKVHQPFDYHEVHENGGCNGPDEGVDIIGSFVTLGWLLRAARDELNDSGCDDVCKDDHHRLRHVDPCGTCFRRFYA